MASQKGTWKRVNSEAGVTDTFQDKDTKPAVFEEENESNNGKRSNSKDLSTKNIQEVLLILF